MRFYLRFTLVFSCLTSIFFNAHCQIRESVSIEKDCLKTYYGEGRSKKLSIYFEIPCNWQEDTSSNKIKKYKSYSFEFEDKHNTTLLTSIKFEDSISNSLEYILKNKNNIYGDITGPEVLLSEKKVKFSDKEWIEHVTFEKMTMLNLVFYNYSITYYHFFDGKLIVISYLIMSTNYDNSNLQYLKQKERFSNLISKTRVIPTSNNEKLENTKIGSYNMSKNGDEGIVAPPLLESKRTDITVLDKQKSHSQVVKNKELDQKHQPISISTLLENSFKVVGFKDGKVRKTGSGYILSSYNVGNEYSHLSVSNAHVIEDLDSLILVFSDNSTYQVDSFLYSNHKNDFTFFQFKAAKKRQGLLRYSDIDNAYEDELGLDILTISSPKGLTNSISNGIISGVRRSVNDILFQITAPISSGSSGGLVARKNGIPIGIIVSQLSEGQNINFAIPLKGALDELILKGIVAKDLTYIRGKNYSLSSMASYYVDNDPILGDIWASQKNSDEFYRKVLSVSNEYLFQSLLFLKINACTDKKNWSEAFSTSFYAWNKYQSPLEAIALIGVISSFSGNIKNLVPFQLNRLREMSANDEFLNVAYQYISGCFALSKDDSETAFNHFSKVEKYIDDVKKVKADTLDPIHNSQLLLSDIMVTKALLSIAQFYGSDNVKNYSKSAYYIEKSLPYIEDESSKVIFLTQGIIAYFLSKETSKACALYSKYFILLRAKADKKTLDIFSSYCN